MATHNLGMGHGSLIENPQTGQVTYRATGKLLPAFTVRISDVTGISVQRKGILTQTMRVNGQGTVLAECEVNHGTADKIRQWFDSRKAPTQAEIPVDASRQALDVNLGDQLAKLAELHRAGALTDEEFTEAKRRVLSA